jgi:hypothetical protein
VIVIAVLTPGLLPYPVIDRHSVAVGVHALHGLLEVPEPRFHPVVRSALLKQLNIRFWTIPLLSVQALPTFALALLPPCCYWCGFATVFSPPAS